MEVYNQTMFHCHTKGFYDDTWQVGKELFVDHHFNAAFAQILSNFNTAVSCGEDNHLTSLDKVIKWNLKTKDVSSLSTELIQKMLKDAVRVIEGINIYNREYVLEKYRKDYYPNLPSRCHSIWLADENSLVFWKATLKNYTVFKVDVTGDLFKSSDTFLPNDELTVLDMYHASEYYWNPVFEYVEDEEKAEYLFQGHVKILEKIDEKIDR